MHKNIKYKISILLIFLSPFVAYCDIKPTFDHSLSLGNISANSTNKELFFTGDLLKYSIVESNSCLKASLYLFALNEADDLFLSELFRDIKPLGFEVAWEPFYNKPNDLRLEVLYRIDSLIDTSPFENWRSVCVVTYSEFFDAPSMHYPMISAELGYWNGKGIYGAIKFDIILGLGLVFGSYLESIYTDNIPDEY